MEIPKYDKLTARIFSLFLTEHCDKDCYYCDIPFKLNPRSTNKELLFDLLPIIEKVGSFERYTITGGEPGLLDRDVLDFVFKTINPFKHPIKVNTNGLFFKKHFNRYKHKIDQVGFHPIIEPTEDLPVECLEPNVIIYIPFHRKNIKHIPDLLKRYPLVMFNPIPYICKKDFDNEDYMITPQHILKLKDQIGNFPNLSPGTFTSILTTIALSSYDKCRLACQNSATRYSFNFVTGHIGRCPESVTLNDRFKMTNENLMKALKFELFPKEKEIVDKACEQCYYFDSFVPYAIRNSVIKSSIAEK